jgi:hypothetical protein
MESVVGIFRTRDEADRAGDRLRQAAVGEVNLLHPGASDDEVESIPTAEAEQPGMGRAIGGVVGAALGTAAGLHIGTVAATTMVPGVGPVVAVGLAAGALLGVGGGFGGAAAGKAIERSTTEGLPADELFFYEDALRHGRSVVFVMARDGAGADRARTILADSAAENLDAAREAWWIGLRSAEQEHYRAGGREFASEDEAAYRAGFESALVRQHRGRDFDSVRETLRRWYPHFSHSASFRRGYERGQIYGQGLWGKWQG